METNLADDIVNSLKESVDLVENLNKNVQNSLIEVLENVLIEVDKSFNGTVENNGAVARA